MDRLDRLYLQQTLPILVVGSIPLTSTILSHKIVSNLVGYFFVYMQLTESM